MWHTRPRVWLLRQEDAVMSDIYLTVAVCTRNRAAMLDECARSVLASCARLKRPWELLVIDNASTDGTSDVLRDLSADAHVRVVREERLGVSHARNAAVANASGKVLAFIDDDVVVREDWAVALCSEFEAQGVGILGGPMLPKWEAPPPWWLTRELHAPLALLETRMMFRDGRRPIVYGGNFALEREAIAGLGASPFNTELGRKGTRLIGNEETYLIEQLWKKGVKIGFAENVVAWHRVPKSRMTLRYFVKWHFFWGISNCREAEIRSGARRLPWVVVGEPLLRAVQAPWYVITLRPARGMWCLSRLVAQAGRIYEHVRTAFQ